MQRIRGGLDPHGGHGDVCPRVNEYFVYISKISNSSLLFQARRAVSDSKPSRLIIYALNLQPSNAPTSLDPKPQHPKP